MVQNSATSSVTSANHSPFRHVYGSLGNGSLLRKETWDAFPSFSLDSNDSHLIKTNGKYMAVNLDSHGSFQVWPTQEVGRFTPLKYSEYLFSGQHTGLPVLDTAFSPTNSSTIASGGEDGQLVIWNIEQRSPTALKRKHDKRIIDLEFPSDICLSSASHDGTVKIWDLTSMDHSLTINIGSPLMDHQWLTSTCILTSSKDRFIRSYDIRAKDIPVMEIPDCHTAKGVKIGKVKENLFISTGFSKQSEREINLWDTRMSLKPICKENLGMGSAPPIPLIDSNRSILYVAIRGESTIKYWSCSSSSLQHLNSYTSMFPLKGLCLYPRENLIEEEWEIGRFLLCHSEPRNIVQSLHMVLPRREGDSIDSLSKKEREIIFPSNQKPLPDQQQRMAALPAKTEEEILSPIDKSPLIEEIEKIHSEFPSIISLQQDKSMTPTSPNIQQIQGMMKKLRSEIEILQERGKEIQKKIDFLDTNLNK